MIFRQTIYTSYPFFPTAHFAACLHTMVNFLQLYSRSTLVYLIPITYLYSFMKFQELIHSETPVLVDFYATWCGPCKAQAPVLEQVARKIGDTARIVKVDVDKNPAAASQYKVQGVPTLILFKQGKILWRQSGVVPAHELEKILKQFA